MCNSSLNCCLYVTSVQGECFSMNESNSAIVTMQRIYYGNFLPKRNIFAKFPADALPQSADQLTAELQKAAHALTFSSNMKYLHFDI